MSSALACPTCLDPFTYVNGPSFPVLLSCGHSVCRTCGDASTSTDPPMCTLCSSPIQVQVTPNHLLAECVVANVEAGGGGGGGGGGVGGEALPSRAQRSHTRSHRDSTVEVGSEEGPSSPLPPCAASCGACERCVWSSLLSTGAACATSSSSFAIAVQQVQEAKRALETSTDNAVSSLWSCIADLKSRVDVLGGKWERAARRVCEDRLKALHAQENELIVTRDQLLAAATIAVSPPEDVDAHTLLRDVHLMSALSTRESMEPIVPSHLNFKFNVDCVDESLGRLVTLVRARVDGSRSVYEGPGLLSFTPSAAGSVVNTIRVTVVDELGAVCVWATVEDLTVRVCANDTLAGGIVGDTVSMTSVGPGVFDAVYSVCDGVPFVWLHIAVCGHLLRSCGPVPVAEPLSTQSLASFTCHAGEYGGIAISPDGRRLVFSCTNEDHASRVRRRWEREQPRRGWGGGIPQHQPYEPWNRLYMFQVGSKGDRAVTIGAQGAGPAQFHRPAGVCFTSTGENILVCDAGNSRVQELSVEGGFIRQFPFSAGHYHSSIASNGEVVALGTRHGTCKELVSIHSYTSGVLLRHVGVASSDPSASLPANAPQICFSPITGHLIALDVPVAAGYGAAGVDAPRPCRILTLSLSSPVGVIRACTSTVPLLGLTVSGEGTIIASCAGTHWFQSVREATGELLQTWGQAGAGTVPATPFAATPFAATPGPPPLPSRYRTPSNSLFSRYGAVLRPTFLAMSPLFPQQLFAFDELSHTVVMFV